MLRKIKILFHKMKWQLIRIEYQFGKLADKIF